MNVALKLTHLGLELDEELAFANVERVVEKADELGNFIRIDMEQSSVLDVTLRIYRRLREAGHENVGTVLQSYLYRTESDLAALLPLRPNLRFVKGAYLEPPTSPTRPRPTSMPRTSASSRPRSSVRATPRSRPRTRRSSRRCRRSPSRTESAVTGSSSRCSTASGPGFSSSSSSAATRCWSRRRTGPEWYPYLMRRLAERPANLGFFAKNLVRR